MKMEQKRFATQNFYMEAVVDEDRIVSLVGCTAKVEMVELNHLQITTPKTQMYYELGTEINWLAEETGTILGMEELLDDYDMYRHNSNDYGDCYPTPPSLYLDEYEECTNSLPVPLKNYFINLHKEFGISPATLQCKTQLQVRLLKDILQAGILSYHELEYAADYCDVSGIDLNDYKDILQQVENFIDHLTHKSTYDRLPVK